MSRLEIPYFSRYAYDPRTRDAAFEVRVQVKRDGFFNDERIIPKLVHHLNINPIPSGFIGGGVVAVPVPKSTPAKTSDDLWVSRQICKALLNAELVEDIVELLFRESPIRTSHSSRGNRPEVNEHISSLGVTAGLHYLEGKALLLVDDFLTLGRTTAACAVVLRNHGFKNPVMAFPLLLTKGIGNYTRFVDPTQGKLVVSPRLKVERQDK